MKKAPGLEQGSVIAMPMGEERWVLAQVLVPGITFYLGAAPVAFSGLPEADQIKGLQLSVFSWTNDAEVYRGNWKLLGTQPLQAAPNPDIAYKVEVSGQMMVEAFNGQLLREFDPRTDENLPYRTSRSPLLVQDMVQAACLTVKTRPT